MDNMKSKYRKALIVLLFAALLTGCNQNFPEEEETTVEIELNNNQSNEVEIHLSDSDIRVDGKEVSKDSGKSVYVANDIIYYEDGKDFTYGEGETDDAHSKEDALAHNVLHITKPGTYRISGKLSKGQLAVDLGEDAKDNPESVVTLVLDGVELTCEVAPAVIFYNVYECGNDDLDQASKDVDTSKAGANVVIADGTTNTINGSYVARIYEPDSVVLNEDKTEVTDADKLHKYDGAFYSRMSMNVNGGDENSGVLNIHAANEGLDSEMHLTINGGNINIDSGNDGINTNEDGISVTTINGGNLTITVNGKTGEGDGIDSNGWLVINGGVVKAAACSDSADAGIDSDMGIHILGGTVMASGHMLDRIEDGGQTYAVFHFTQKQNGAEEILLKDKDGTSLMEYTPQNAYSMLIYSSGELGEGTYSLWSDKKQLEGQNGGMMGGFGKPEMDAEGMTPPEKDENMQPPEGMERPEGMELPEGGQQPEGMETPEGVERPERMEPSEGMELPEGVKPPDARNQLSDNQNVQSSSVDFQMKNGANMFTGIKYAE